MVAATAVDRLNPIAAMAHDKKRIVLSVKENISFWKICCVWQDAFPVDIGRYCLLEYAKPELCKKACSYISCMGCKVAVKEWTFGLRMPCRLFML